MTRLLLGGLVAILMVACAASVPDNGNPILIDGLKIDNQTGMHVSAVRVLIPATGGFVSCGNIAQKSMCSTGFPETSYSGNPIEITWSQAGQIHSTGQFELKLPDDLEPGIPAMVHVVIAGPGSAGAMIVQHKSP